MVIASVKPAAGPATSARLSTKTAPSKHESTSTTTRDQVQAISDEKLRMPMTTKKKSMAELDEELRLKLEGMSGEGGAAGIEYENGKAEGLKRGVKSNMFRVI